MPHKTSDEVKMENGSVLAQIKQEVVPQRAQPLHSKITIVGAGQVGMACAYAMLIQNTARELALVDVAEDRLRGELMDLQHGLPFVKNCTLRASSDYAISAQSDLVVLTAGARQRPGESRLDLLGRNVTIFRGILEQVVRYSPDCVLLVVSNPVDVLTYVAWRLSGLPAQRVLGSGTNLDSARFKFLLSERLGVAPVSCHGWVIGEHGDSSVAVWSGANIAGVKLEGINPQIGTEKDEENWGALHKQVVDSAYEIIKLKGYTSYAIGLSVAHICHCVLQNIRQILAVSVNVKGLHGIADDVYLSLPAVVGEQGVTDIIRQQLTDQERQQLQQSAQGLLELQQQLGL